MHTLNATRRCLLLQTKARPCTSCRPPHQAQRGHQPRVAYGAYSTTPPTPNGNTKTLPTNTLTNITPTEIHKARTYCQTLLRTYDTPSHTLLPFIPPTARDAYLALRALNITLSQIGDSTSSSFSGSPGSPIGSMRMQFWRDTITKSLSLAPPKEPVGVLLASAQATLLSRTSGSGTGSSRGLSRAWLLRLISERERALRNPPYPDLKALEGYAENTYSTLLYLTLSALPMQSLSADHVASHIGKAMGICAVLRGVPLLAFPGAARHHSPQTAYGGVAGGQQQGSVMLPLDVMVEAGVREEEVLRMGSEAKGLKDAVFAVATRASDHLITAREMVKNLRLGKGEGHEFEHLDDVEHTSGQQDGAKDIERGFGVLMPAVATHMWLDRLQKCDFDIFHESLRRSDWKLPFKTYWAFGRKQF